MTSTSTHSKLEDENALRNLMAKYTDAVHRRDADNWADCWTEDAHWNLMGTEVSGKESILGLWLQIMSGMEFALMMPSSSLFEIDGDTASGHWYLQEFTRDKEGNAMTILSRYMDSYRKIDNEWYFQSREYQFMYNGDANLSGQYSAL